MEKKPRDKEGQELEGCVDAATLFPALTIDWDLYERYLEASDLTDDQKRELIETLWYIVVAFVDLGFGIEPVQYALREGKNEESNSASPFLDVVKESVLTHEFSSAKNRTTEKEKIEEGLKQ